jgi:uncharacterized protein YndB with AHSA1/START domain
MSDIVMQVDIAANRGKVKDALTTHAGITGWWTVQAEVPAGTGQLLKPSFVEAPMPFDLRVDEMTDEKIVWRTQSFPPNWVGTAITWTLSDNPDGPGTRVLFSHSGFQSGDAGMPPAAYTWGQLLVRLKDYVESGTPHPLFVR